MNVLIPLRNTSPNNYYELRFAIRSLCKHNPVERVLLVGGKPDWFIGEHLPHKDYDLKHKEENIRDKTNAGVQMLKSDFLYSNDDFFVLAPYPSAHNKGLLSENLKNRQPNGSYTRMLQNTLAHFGDVVNVDTHCPLMMTAEGVERTVFDWPEWGLCFKTTYAAVNGIESVYYPDTKVRDIADIEDTGILYFSTYEGCKNLQLLFDLFPEKSIFER